jgi:hypothetical protein
MAGVFTQGLAAVRAARRAPTGGRHHALRAGTSSTQTRLLTLLSDKLVQQLLQLAGEQAGWVDRWQLCQTQSPRLLSCWRCGWLARSWLVLSTEESTAAAFVCVQLLPETGRPGTKQ